MLIMDLLHDECWSHYDIAEKKKTDAVILTLTYIHHWLQILQGDSKAIFTAAAKAQNAADFILDKAGIMNAQVEPLPATA